MPTNQSVRISPHFLGRTYLSSYDWPSDSFLQAGTDGIVCVVNGTSYRTAFFEAFPRTPDTYIRGEGETMADAEAFAWAKWQKIVTCPGHEWETRGYTNGGQFCKHCGLFVIDKTGQPVANDMLAEIKPRPYPILTGFGPYRKPKESRE